METIKNQEKTFRKDLANDEVIVVRMRHDDRCGNGHNTFSITADTYGPHMHRGEPKLHHENGRTVWLDSCGCQHNLIAKHFPTYARMIRWHLTSTDGPMHYIANTVFWASEGNLDAARRCAVWPDATLEQLKDKAALEARLPALLSEFRRDVEALGFQY